MKSIEVSFYSGGRKLKGVLNTPDESGHRIPCVIMCHGYCGFRDENGAFEPCALRFCESGIGALRFDFSGCGESAGLENRGKMLCATEWVQDICSAYEYVRTLPWVDCNKISTFGMSMGAMAVLASAKYLKGLYSVISVAPVNNGFTWLEGLWTNTFGSEAFRSFCEKAARQNSVRVLTGTDEFEDVAGILAFSPVDLEMFLNNVKNFPLTAAKASWSSVYEILNLVDAKRELLSSSLQTPVLFIHGDSDTLVNCEGTKDIYESYQHEKKLLILPGENHGLLSSEAFSGIFGQICEWAAANPYRKLQKGVRYENRN